MIFQTLFALIIGVLLGNFASTVLFRLPRGIPINGYNPETGKAPHCSICGHNLKFYEYLPILSWIFSRGKCNYCGVKINLQYTILEVSISILAALLCFIAPNFSENYLILLFAGAGLILSIFLSRENQDNPNIILFLVGILGALYRTLNEGSILYWLVSSLLAYFIYAFVISKGEGSKYNKLGLRLILLSGVWLNIVCLLVYLISIFILYNLKGVSLYRRNIISIVLLYVFILVMEYKYFI